MKVNKNIMAVILLAIFFGGIGISKSLNFWSTESSKTPAVFKDGEFKGEYNPSDIRGSYSFSDIEKSFNIPINVLAKAFGVEEKDAPSFQNKGLEEKYSGLENEIGTASVRLFVSLYKGLPVNLEVEEAYLPDMAVKILKETDKLTDEQLKYIESHSVEIKGTTSNSSTSSEKTEEEPLIKGKTTFKEIIDLGIKSEDIEEIIGGKIPSTGMTVRDYCEDKGIEFSIVKEKLQEKLD